MIVEAGVQETTRRTRTTKTTKDQDLEALPTQDLRVEVEVEKTAGRPVTNQEITQETKDSQEGDLIEEQQRQ